MTKLKGLFKVIYVIPLLWLMGCSTTMYRNNNTYLLRKNNIEWPKNQFIEDKSNLTYVLKTNLKPAINNTDDMYRKVPKLHTPSFSRTT